MLGETAGHETFQLGQRHKGVRTFPTLRREAYSHFWAVSRKLGDRHFHNKPTSPRAWHQRGGAVVTQSRQGRGSPLGPAASLPSPILFPSCVCFR